jgi:hypothetical protein
MAGWAATGLFPFDPERVLRGIQKPPAKLSAPDATNVAIGSDVHQRLQRHVQKLASAAKISFIECALLQDQNRFLLKANNEVKLRRSVRSVVLGKAKVMSYKDLEEARAKRDVKEKAIAVKGKRGRKRKSPAPEPGVEANLSASKKKAVRLSEAEPANLVGMSWRAPVAKMY